MTNFADVHAVDRKGARSGRVSYADPIVLHETSRRQVLLVRFFIKRSFGTDMAATFWSVCQMVKRNSALMIPRLLPLR